MDPRLNIQVQKLQGYPNPASGTFSLTARNQDLVFSVPLIGSIFGGLATTPISKRLGRKWTLIFAYAFSIIGGFLQVFAPNLGAFVVGRFLSDFVIGIAHTIAPCTYVRSCQPRCAAAASQSTTS